MKLFLAGLLLGVIGETLSYIVLVLAKYRSIRKIDKRTASTIPFVLNFVFIIPWITINFQDGVFDIVVHGVFILGIVASYLPLATFAFFVRVRE